MNNYFKPNTKTAIKLATAIKGLTLAAASWPAITGNSLYSFIILATGAIATEVIQFLSDGTEKSKDNAPTN